MSSKALILLFCVYYSYENREYSSYEIPEYPDCGNDPKTKTQFIIGGQNAENFPFMASIYTEGIDHNWERQNFSLLLGTTDIRNDIRSHTLFGINQRITSECYARTELGDYDIALIRLTKPIETNHNIQTICLPPKNSEPIENKDIFVLGWGTANYTKEKKAEQSLFLQKTKMELHSEEFCRAYIFFRKLGTTSLTLTGDRLCLRSMTSTACHGDSGGPAFQKINEKWYQIGVASFGEETLPDISDIFTQKTQCFISAPVFYVKTSAYIDWIESTIKKYWNSTENLVKTKC